MDRNFERVWRVAFAWGEDDDDVVDNETIWAFCFITSAGVRMAHETSSAREEAEAWIKGVGRTPPGEEEVVFRRVKRDFVRS